MNIPACISCYLGVTEPALFGVNLKYGFPLVCGMIGSACGAVISIGTGVEAYSIGVGGLPGILSIKPQFWLNFLIAMLAAVAVPFVLTILVGSRKLSAADRGLSAVSAEHAAPSVVPDAEEQPQAEPPAAGAEGITAPCPAGSSPWRRSPTRCSPRVSWGRGWASSPPAMW